MLLETVKIPAFVKPGNFVKVIDTISMNGGESFVGFIYRIDDCGVCYLDAEYPVGLIAVPYLRGCFSKANKPADWIFSDKVDWLTEYHPRIKVTRDLYQVKGAPRKKSTTSIIIPKKSPRKKAPSKADKALKLVREHPTLDRKEMIKIFKENMTMSDACANTYYYNAHNKIKTEK